MTTATLTDFRTHTSQHIARLRRTGEPEVLTLHGKPQSVVLSPEAFEKMAALAEYQTSVADIRTSLAEYEAGKGMNAKDALRKLARKHKVVLKG